MKLSQVRRDRYLRVSRRAIVGGFTGLIGYPAIRANSQPGFRLGLTPVFLDDDLTLLRKLRDYLSRRLGRAVEFVQRRTHQEISTMLLSRQLDAAWICDFSYVQRRDKLALLAVPLYRNQPLRQAYVIVNRHVDARTFDDVRGTVHAFADPDSTSGYLVTRWLLAKRGESPANFFKAAFFAYSHRNVIRGIGGGLGESGSVDGYIWEIMRAKEPQLVDNTRIVFRSEWLGFPPVVSLEMTAQLPEIKALAVALLDMTSDESGRGTLSQLNLDGFTTANPDLYESTAEMWRVVNEQG